MSKLRNFKFPQYLEEKIWIELEKLNCDPNDISRIKECILRLSNHFIDASSRSPLSEKWAQIAYLAYYFPLNFLRAQAVCEEAQRLNFFTGLKSAVDIGSGLGSLTLNLAQANLTQLNSLDVSGEALEIQKRLFENSNSILPLRSVKFTKQDKLNTEEQYDLACLSYSWNEFSDLEKTNFLNHAQKFEALLIIEPSTSLHARQLMETRAKLIKSNYNAWGPCTHNLGCPLLIHSKTDWCHDRIKIEHSKWSQAIEKVLPFKNETITYSYLLMRKTKPQDKTILSEGLQFSPARVIGDELVEKGKNRQAVCRSDEREFFSWFPQRLKHNNFGYIHGELIHLNKLTQKKSNELRINETDVIKEKD